MRTLILVLGFYLVGCAGTKVSRLEPQGDGGKIYYAQNSDLAKRNMQEASGANYAISTQGKAASEAASAILAAGGNLVDAAIAASFAISVERPQSTGIGGGGFMLIYSAKDKSTVAIDFRERAPRRAGRDMYLDKKGEVIPNLSTDGILSVAVPGLVAGLLEIHEKYGSLPRAKVMEPAIALAQNGFPIYPYLAEALKDRSEVLEKFPASKKIFFRGQRPLQEGEILKQPDLAKTLRLISRYGKDVFYRGEITQAILKESKRTNGLLTKEDFADYKVKWREPVKGTYKDFTIVSMPPPSSGGTHVVQILNIIEKDQLNAYGSFAGVQLISSAMQQAFADRAKFMGDPDFVKIPLADLLSKKYAAEVRQGISLDKFKSADSVSPGVLPKKTSNETTHLSLMDKEGNVVVSTQTINGWMGSAQVVPGTGILLNNEMDDFSAKPGAANLYGAIGGSANAIVPGKTPLSSMSPTIVFRDGKPIMGVGAPGGTRIITCVLQTIVNYLDFGMSLYDSIAAVRFHQQWRPEDLYVESPGFAPATMAALAAAGQKIKLSPDAIGCRVMAVSREGDWLKAVTDPRDAGIAIGK